MDNKLLKEYAEFLKKEYARNKRVLFIQCPQFDIRLFNPEIALKKGYCAFPPTGLQFLCESLMGRDMALQIFDLNFSMLQYVHEKKSFDYSVWLEMVYKRLDSFDPYIVGLSGMFDVSIGFMAELLAHLKWLRRSIVVAGGIIATYEWNNLLSRDLCQFVIEGEGEQKLNHLFDYLTDEDMNTAPTKGIHFKYRNSYWESSGDTGIVKEIGSIIKSYALVKIEDYYQYGSLNPFSRIAGIDSAPFSALQMSRGCRGACTFCSARSFMGKGVRKRDAEDILKEIEFLITQRGIRHFELLDDDALFHRDNFMRVLKGIIEKKWDITWSANNGLIASSIDDDLLGLMQDSGCIGFKIGIETGNIQMLKKIRKPVNLGQVRQLVNALPKFPNIFVGGNFMIGFPEERFTQMLDTFNFSMELDLDWAAFTVCQAIRGAEAFSENGEYFKLQMNSNGEVLKNFIPSRQSSLNEVPKSSILRGLDIFTIAADAILTEHQVNEIWYTFNIIRNYIYNKNLRPDGRVEKFIGWVEKALVPYPTNPYMNFFLAMAFLIKGDKERAEIYRRNATAASNLSAWEERLSSFGFSSRLDDFPRDRKEVFNKLEELKYAITQRIPEGH